MKTFLRILLALVALIVVAGVIAYADGTTLPVDHTVSVEGNVQAPPAKVFALITGVANAPAWRKEVKSVQALPPDGGRDHWIEDLGHGVQMNFLAIRTEPPPRPETPSASSTSRTQATAAPGPTK